MKWKPSPPAGTVEETANAAPEGEGSSVLLRHALRLGRALVVLGAFLDGPQGAACDHGRHEGRDVLDADIRSVKTLDRVWQEASEVSRCWGIVTTLRPEDFRAALQEAHVAA